jgi:hypothetical protein
MKPQIDLSTAVMEIHAIETECLMLISQATDEAMRLRNDPKRALHEAYYQGKKTGLRQIVLACKKAIAAIQPQGV